MLQRQLQSEMKIKIKVKPGSSQEKIEKIDNINYIVWLKDKPIEGKANIKLLKILKKYFGKNVEIISGFLGRDKIIELK